MVGEEGENGDGRGGKGKGSVCVRGDGRACGGMGKGGSLESDGD